jgi:hypothetical protein
MVFNMFKRKPEFPTNEAILKAIVNLATHQRKEDFKSYYTILLNSSLLIAHEEGQSRPILLTDENDDIILPVFTDLGRLREVFPDALRAAPLPLTQLCQLSLSSHIFQININPEKGPGAYLDKREIEAFAQGVIPDIIVSSGSSLGAEANFVPMGDPKLPTEAVLDEMTVKACTLLEQQPSVDEAYLIMTRNAKNQSLMTIGLYSYTQKYKSDMAAFSQRFVNEIEAIIKRQLHLMWLEDGDVNTIRMNVEPFYKRGEH